ncbi:MAG: DUF1273 family protein [Clostridia bacterium]|nr:DUF1273 family protein [Clostridia bacterium]
MEQSKKAQRCCFSGHRSLPAEYENKIRCTLEKVVCHIAGIGYTEFISGGALGFDLLAAEVIIEKKKSIPQLKLIMALPCRDQNMKWSEADKRRYEKVLSCADEIIYVTEKYCTGCMHLRNKFMVENSSMCIAYKTRRNGGTSHTVDYAKEKGLGIINISEVLE